MAEEVVPIILCASSVHPQVLLQRLDCALGLSIRLLMMGGGHVQRCSKAGEQTGPKETREARVSIGYNRRWKSMVLEDVFEEQLRQIGCCACCFARDEDRRFAVSVNKDSDGIVTRLGLG